MAAEHAEGVAEQRGRVVPLFPGADVAPGYTVCWVPALVPASAIAGCNSAEWCERSGGICMLPSQPERDSVSARCEQLAASGALSPREAEVLGYLARGRNAQYLQKRLAISPGTAKAHISHIYRKLGVCNQQELLDLVEEPLGRGRAVHLRSVPRTR